MIPIDQTDLQRIRSYFSETILNRGWGYYRGRAVSRLQMEGHCARALVAGTKSYQVQLDFHNFPASACTCPYDDYCKHMAAVLFEIAAQMKPDMLAPHHQLALVPKRDTQPSAPFRVMDPPRETESVEEWHEKIDRILEEERGRSGWVSSEVFLRKGETQLLPYGEEWAPDIRALYVLNVGMHLVEVLEEMHRQPSYQYYESPGYVRSVTVRWIGNLYDQVAKLQMERHSRGYRERLEDTIRVLSRAAFPQLESVADWAQFYRVFWVTVPVDEKMIEQEILRLRAEKERPAHTFGQQKLLLQALIHLLILTDQDEAAMNAAEGERPLLVMDEVFEYLRSFVVYQKWSRLYKWLNWLRLTSRNLQPALVYQYVDCWRALKREGYVEDKEWEHILADLLPVTLNEYLQLLLHQERYREWVDLHLWYESDPLELEKGELSLVADEDLPSLLPLYHRAAERWIREKNRDAYKRAVKILKKLKSHYRKLKQLPRWEQYIEGISMKYKRLSAFREELMKGKLLP